MIRFARGQWGMPGSDPADHFRTIAEAGYDAVEACVDDDATTVRALSKAASSSGLRWIAQIHTRRDGQPDGRERLGRHYRLACELGAALVNLHTGGDLLDDSANDPLFECAERLADETGIPCVHETHRGRATWSAPATARLMERHPHARFCADLSHWCCVHESLLERSSEVISRVLERSDLIHARVGHAEGPQVADWRDPLVAREFAAHLTWWDEAAANARATSRDLTICMEFGGSPYQPSMPFTGEPLSDGWDVNLSLMRLLQSRYQAA